VRLVDYYLIYIEVPLRCNIISFAHTGPVFAGHSVRVGTRLWETDG